MSSSFFVIIPIFDFNFGALKIVFNEITKTFSEEAYEDYYSNGVAGIPL